MFPLILKKIIRPFFICCSTGEKDRDEQYGQENKRDSCQIQAIGPSFRACQYAELDVFRQISLIPVWTYGEVPFVPTPPEVIDRMLEMARVARDDLIYDLGSGDGRIIIHAAKRYGVRGVGIEIDGDLVRKAQDNAFREKVDHLVEFREQDALTVDVSRATVVTLYMLPEFNAKLRPILSRQLSPGARVVSHDFAIEGWVPDRFERVKGDFLHDHTILLFENR